MSYAAVDREIVRGADDRRFCAYLDAWLEESLAAFFRGRDPREPLDFQSRRSWEDGMRRAGWSGLGWPERYGGWIST